MRPSNQNIFSDSFIRLIAESFGEYGEIDPHLVRIFPRFRSLLHEMTLVTTANDVQVGILIHFSLRIMWRTAISLLLKLARSPMLMIYLVISSPRSLLSMVVDEVNLLIRGYWNWPRILVLCVSPQVRRKGVGMELVREFLRTQTRVMVTTYSSDAANYFYPRCGFSLCGEWQNIFSRRRVYLMTWTEN